MKDFLKIFLVLGTVAISFLFGRNHGEKTYRESAEFRQIAKSNEELGFARNDLENIKAKLQNITDASAQKKADALLAEIFQVFENDMGLKLSHKDEILKNAAAKVEEKKIEVKPEVKLDAKIEAKPEPKKDLWSRASETKFKSYEWMVANSDGAPGALTNLKKVQIRNIAAFLKESEYDNACEDFLGSYKGSVKDIENNYFGSLEFELKKELSGKVAWYNNDSAFSEKISKNCGRKISGLSGRVFSISADKYVQLYKLNNVDKTAGNFYEVLPNGTTKIIGSFVLNRVDKF